MKKGRPYNTAKDFWEKVDKSNNCWEWQKACSPSGYGKSTWKNKTWRSHRLAYFLTHGEVPKLVMHTCDNRKCCNPSHLVDGTHRDNMKDMALKGRAFKPKGTKHSQSKYDDIKILTIRTLHQAGFTITNLANTMKINSGYISQIVHRKRWSHI